VGGWQVNLSFNASGATDFAKVTAELAGKQEPQNQFAIVLDGLVQSAPRVNEPITGGQAQITGNFTQEEAKSLANVLKFGALPISLDVQSVDSVSPTLGSDQLRAGIIAGLLGLLLVVIYLLIYYRALGLVAVVSLLVAAALTYFLFVILGRTIGFTLSLAGVAGAIIAIGITADSFVVYFERIRDEIREGRTLRQACDAGWIRSRRTILAADFVSLLAAVVLYIVSVGNVRGFAFTLGLTTVIDVFVAFFFTRPLVSLLARNPWFSKGGPWTGLDPKRLGVTEIATGTRRKPASGSARRSMAAAGATTATALAETDEMVDEVEDVPPTKPASTPNPDGEV
jgi:preprotein translocase subunit SecD